MSGTSGRAAPPVRVRGYRGAVLDVNSGVLRRDHVLVQSGQRGYFVAGFGASNLPMRKISNIATAVVHVDGGVFDPHAYVLGKVFADCNNDGLQQAGINARRGGCFDVLKLHIKQLKHMVMA